MPRFHRIIISALCLSTLSIAIVLMSTISNVQDMPLPTLAKLEAYSTTSVTKYNDETLPNQEFPIEENQEVLIQFKDSQSPEIVDTVLDKLNAEIIERVPEGDSIVVRSTNPITVEQVESLAPSVLIEPNYRVKSLLTFPTNDPLAGDQWALESVQINNHWEAMDDSTDVVVIAVIDSGVCFNHPDLQGRFLDNGFDFVDEDSDPTDEMGHGCAVSGIIGATANNSIGITGIAPNSKILPLRVLDENGSGTYANVIRAIYYAVDNGADIINLSLGGQNHSQILEQAVNYAVSRDLDVVAGSGNTGQEGVFYPARYPNVIAVGSYDENGNQSTFSTYGNEVDTLAPGENILSTTLNGDYGRFIGTSMAVPHVSGLLALSRSSGQPINLANSMSTPAPSNNEQVEALATGTPPPTATHTPISLTPTATSTYSTCGLTDIELASVDADSISYQVDDVASIDEYLIDMDHELYSDFTPASSTIALNNITYAGATIWQADGSNANRIDDGTWLSSPWLDDGMLTIHYNTSFDLTDYFSVDDFSTRFYVHNSDSNTDCNFIADYAPPSPDSPTNLSGTVNGAEINLTWTDSTTTETNFIVERQVVGGMWEEVATLPADTTEYTGSIVCDVSNRWQVRAYDSNTDTYSPPSFPVTFVIPCLLSEPSNLTALATISGTQLDWEISSEGVYDKIRLYRQVSSVDNNFVTLIDFDEETTSYLDTTEFYCDMEITYKIETLRWFAGQYVYSDPAIANFTSSLPNCIEILPPTNFTVERDDTGVQLSWTPANDMYSYFVYDYKIVGQDTDFKQINYTSLNTYHHNIHFECDSYQVDYRIRTRYHHETLGWRYSEPVILPYFEVCPQTDLELEITSNISSPAPYTPVVITLTVKNIGDETAHDLTIRQHDLASYFVLDYTASTGTYSPYSRYWSFNSLPGNSQATLQITLLAQQDIVTGQQPLSFEIEDTDAIDTDSEWNNNDPTEDDYATITLGLSCPSTSIFNVADGDADGLVQAISSANYETCFPGQDTITLANDGYYELDKSIFELEGWNAFHPILTDIIVEGNHSTLESTRPERAFIVSEDGTLQLNQLAVERFNSNNSKKGSVVLNYGTTTLNEVRLKSNTDNQGTTVYSDGEFAHLEIYNSYLANGGYYQVLVGADSAALIENSTIVINSTGVGVYGTLDSYFTTYRRSHNNSYIKRLDDDALVNLYANIFQRYTSSDSACTGSGTTQTGYNSLGYNVTRDCSYGNPTDIGGINNLIEQSTVNNSDFVPVYAPAAGSLAIDLIPPELCSISRDQNGAYRPQDSNDDGIIGCNAGAYENKAELNIEVEIDSDTPSNGDTVTLTLNFANQSVFEATEATVDIEAPQGMTYLGAISATAGTVSPISNTQQWVLPTLANSATESVQLQYRVDGPFSTINDAFNVDYTANHRNAQVTDNTVLNIATDCGTDLHIYNIPDGDEEGFAQAIIDANNETCVTHTHQINLAPNGDYVFDEAYGEVVPYATLSSWLPIINSDITITGDKTVLSPIIGQNRRLLHVSTSAKLHIDGLIIRDFDLSNTPSTNPIIMSQSNLHISNSEFYDNQGLQTVFGESGAEILVENSLFWNNSDFSIYLSSNTSGTVRNSTVGQDSGHDVTSIRADYGSIIHLLHNTIIGDDQTYSIHAYNSELATGTANLLINARCRVKYSSWTSLGYNASTSDCNLWDSTDLTNQSLAVTPLGDYGGATRTVIPISGNPVIDLIPANDCVLPFDQRGIARPVNGNCDAGAVEVTYTLNTPTAIQATPDFDNQLLTVSWVDNSSDETGFTVLRKGSNDIAWESIGNVSANMTQFIDTDILSCSQTYDYVVFAFDDTSGLSPLSEVATSVNHNCVPLDVPDLSITPVSATTLPDTVIDLTWLDTNVNITGWHIEKRVDSGNWEQIATITDNPELQQTLVCESNYDYRVQTYRDSDNTVSDWSNIVSFVSGDCPESPIIASITGTSYHEIEIEFAPYTPSDALINIEYRLAGSSDVWQLEHSVRADQLTPFAVDNLTCSTNYEFHTIAIVDSITPAQSSDWSDVVIGSTQDCIPLVAPALSLTAITSTTVPGADANLTWVDSNVSGTYWYVEYRRNGGNWVNLSKVSGNTELSTHLSCNSTYEYRVLAFQGDFSSYNWAGTSDWSNTVSHITGNCPEVPVIISISPTKSDKIMITWQPEPGINRRMKVDYRPSGETIWDMHTSANMYTGQLPIYLPACNLTYDIRFRQRWYYDSVEYFSDYSEIYTVTSFECLTPPINLTAITSTDTSITIGWQNTTARTDYETLILAYDDFIGDWNEIDRIPTAQTQYTLSCLTSESYKLQLYHPTQDEYSPLSDAISVNDSNCEAEDQQSGPTFTVTTTDDVRRICSIQYCSLRGAIEASNQMAGLNTINLPDGLYTMQIDGVYEDDNKTGDYDIFDDLVILGNASATTIIDGAKIERIFHVVQDASFSIDNVTLQNSNDVLWNSYSEIVGGLIRAYQVGDISITNSILQDGYGYQGGALHVEFGETVTIDNSIFRNNTAYMFAGAVELYDVLTIITNSTFDNNHALLDRGGAIDQFGESISIYDSEFINNVTGGRGGGLNAREINEIVNTNFINNQAEDGGAIHAVVGGQIKDSAIINNQATRNGGGIFLWESVQLQNLTISGNSAENYGGGVFTYGGNTFTNLTIVNNQAHNDALTAQGGGFYHDSIYNRYPSLYNTLIANNVSDISVADDCHMTGNGSGTIANSVIETTDNCNAVNTVNNSIFGIDAPISALQSNFGTYYHDLLAGNPAINNADDVLCSVNDQLDNFRPVGVHCDVGAAESSYNLNPPTNLTGSVSYSDISITWDDNSQYDQSVVVERSLDGANWSEIATLSADTNTYLDTGLDCPLAYHYRVSSRASSYIEYSNSWVGSLSEPCHLLQFLSPITATFITESTAQVSWTDDNSDEDGYRVLKWVSGTWSEVASLAPDQISFNDPAITCQSDSTYEYRIEAYRDVDNITATSHTTDIWTGNCPFNAPTSLTASTITDAQVGMTWLDNSSLESDYSLSRSTDNTNWTTLASLPADTTSFTDTALECEKLYYYRLQGYQSLFDRYTNTVTMSATTAKCEVAIPESVTTTVASNQTSINWNPIPPQQTTQFTVERAEQPADALVSLSGEQSYNWQAKATLLGGVNVFTDDDIRCGMIYWYRIQGYNEHHNEYTAYSDPIEIMTSECPVPVTNTVGLYQNGLWVFRDGFDNSAPILTFRFGPQESGWIPLTGDWDGDGVDGIGIYKDGIFVLRDVSERGVSDYAYRFGNRDSGAQPIVGDWDGNGQDTVGLYKDGLFILTNSHDTHNIDHQFTFGRRESGWTAIAGDWTAGGRDFVGLYKEGVFQLHNSFKTQASGQFFRFGPVTGDWTPIAGDWDADGSTTIGLYKDKSWRFRNSNSRGQVDIGFTFGNFNGVAYPIASYRGGEEALEALAFVSQMPLPDISESSDTPDVQPVEATPTETILISVSPTAVDMTPTLTLTAPVSGTVTSEPDMSVTPTAEEIQPEATQEATVEAIETAIPTITLTATADPTIVPTFTAIPGATVMPTSTPIPTQVISEPTTEEIQPEATQEATME